MRLLARRAREELLAAGARPRRHVLTGPGSLTAAEARVARLAAEGHTNRAIAERLYVTERTVETHLTRAFDKLEISSRTALADGTRRAGPGEVTDGPQVPPGRLRGNPKDARRPASKRVTSCTREPARASTNNPRACQTPVSGSSS